MHMNLITRYTTLIFIDSILILPGVQSTTRVVGYGACNAERYHERLHETTADGSVLLTFAGLRSDFLLRSLV